MFILNEPYSMNPVETTFIMEYCEARFDKYKYPCKTCRYKANRKAKHDYCIFVNTPRDWTINMQS